MTDLEAFIELYLKFGIDCKVNQCTETGNQFIILAPSNYYSGLIEWSENFSPTESDKIEGHHGFYSRIDFDKDGKFISQGFWE